MPDRNKVIGELEYCRHNPKCNACDRCQYGGRSIMTCESLVDDAIALLKEQEHGWISVYDQLPETGTVVLALGKRTSSTGVFQGTSRYERPDLWWWKGHIIRETTHWMHLPEPPKEGK